MKPKRTELKTPGPGITPEAIEEVSLALLGAGAFLWRRLNLGRFSSHDQAKGLMDASRHIEAARDLVIQHLSQLPLPETPGPEETTATLKRKSTGEEYPLPHFSEPSKEETHESRV